MIKKRIRKRTLSLSEVMTILVLFHLSGYRNLKQFYLEFVSQSPTSEFPAPVSYNRFVEFEGDALMPLAAYLQTKRGACTSISFVDSTKLAVCENLRIPQHRQFVDTAGRGKTSMGWFYGFKLHVAVSEYGQLLSWLITRRAMWMTANRFRVWLKNCGANYSATKVTFPLRSNCCSRNTAWIFSPK